MQTSPPPSPYAFMIWVLWMMWSVLNRMKEFSDFMFKVIMKSSLKIGVMMSQKLLKNDHSLKNKNLKKSEI